MVQLSITQRSFANSVPGGGDWKLSFVSFARYHGSDELTLRPKQQRSTGRLWLFRGAAIGCGIAPFVILELALWIFGFGHSARLLVPVAGSPGWFQFNASFDEPFFDKFDLTGPEVRPFQLPKPATLLRVVVVGGSTVAGFPFPPELAFARHLEILLQHAINDGKQIEVLNAGITAVNSTIEVAVTEQVIKCEPDLIVVYTGHNEFYGPGGTAAVGGGWSPGWTRRIANCCSWRTFQMIQRLRKMISRPTTKSLIEQLATDVRIPEDSPIFRSAVARLEENLNAMVTLATNHGIPMLLVAPACNERDQPPIEPAISSTAVNGEPAWHQVLRKAEALLIVGHADQALKTLETIAAETKSVAIVQYRLAQAHDQLGEYSFATTCYRRARDLDGGRFRAPSEFQKVFAKVAERHARVAVRWLDLQVALESITGSPGILGRADFLEHVHFTLAGNTAAARAIGPAACELMRLPGKLPPPELFADEVAKRLSFQPEDYLAGNTLARSIYGSPPFRDAADASLLEKSLAIETLPQYRRMPDSRKTICETLMSDEIGEDILSTVIRRAQLTGQTQDIGPLLKARVLRRPWILSARLEYADWLKDNGNPDGAEALLHEKGVWPSVLSDHK